MAEELGIACEIDLRNSEGGTAWIPNPVEGENYYWARGSGVIGSGPSTMWDANVVERLSAEFKLLLKNLKKGVAGQFHCRIGADRTGVFGSILLGILGASEADILRDYETTSFSEVGTRQFTTYGYDSALKKLKTNASTSSLCEAYEYYFINTLGVSQTDINSFREIMLGDDPTPSGIDDVVVNGDDEEVSSRVKGTFNLAGQKVGDDYKGFVIRDGKKCYVK